MKKIRLGFIGSGGMAAHRGRRFQQLEGCELIALLARNPETGQALAMDLGIPLMSDEDDLLRRVDAVVVCTHNESHARLAIVALEAGKHVFTEYPAMRSFEEGERLMALMETSGCVLRVAHETAISATQKALRQQASSLGPLLLSTFVRLTPGRGRRPEMLFNLPVSGPPALFFVYHIYPVVDLFGPAAWVEGGAEYVGLTEGGRYDRFVNTVTVGFEKGGVGQWTWAGGVEIKEAEEYQRLVLTGGTLIRDGEGWSRSTPAGVEKLQLPPEGDDSLETLFIEESREGKTGWKGDARKALDAARIGLAAEVSMKEERRIHLKETPN